VYSLDVKLVPTLSLFTLLVLAVFLGYHIDNTPVKATADAPTLTKTVAEKTTVETPAPDPLPTLVADMNAPIAAQPGLSASATLIDLNTGKEYDTGNYTQTYEAASTSKLVAIFDYIHLVEQGKATLTQMIDGQQAQDIIMRMIVYSDNDAWDTLNGYLTFGGEQAYLDSIGVAGKMTPEDIQFSTPAMAKLLRLLYHGKLMNPTNQAMIYNYMSHTTMNSLIPAALPADASAEDIQNEVYAIGKDESYGFASLRDWFKALYETLLGAEQGPRMGSFIALYGVENSRTLIGEALAKAA